MKKNLLAASALVLAAVLTLGACGTANTAGSAATTAAAATAPLVIKVGHDAAYPPMEFAGEDGKPTGFDVEFINAVAEKMGATVEFTNVAWDGIFGGLEAGRYDMIVSAVSITAERQEKFEFTKPYLANGQVIVVKPGDTSIKTSADLAGKKVGVQTETTADIACKKALETMQFDLTRYDDIIQTFEAMSTGRLDCIVVDAVVAMDYAGKQPEKYAVTSAQLTNEPIAICLKKGNTDLRDKVQVAIDALREEGKLAEISKKWFGSDFTSNIDEKLY